MTLTLVPLVQCVRSQSQSQPTNKTDNPSVVLLMKLNTNATFAMDKSLSPWNKLTQLDLRLHPQLIIDNSVDLCPPKRTKRCSTSTAHFFPSSPSFLLRRSSSTHSPSAPAVPASPSTSVRTSSPCSRRNSWPSRRWTRFDRRSAFRREQIKSPPSSAVKHNLEMWVILLRCHEMIRIIRIRWPEEVKEREITCQQGTSVDWTRQRGRLSGEWESNWTSFRGWLFWSTRDVSKLWN